MEVGDGSSVSASGGGASGGGWRGSPLMSVLQ